MSDISQVITQLSNNNALPLIVILIGLFVILYFNRSKIKQGWLNFRTHYTINRLGLEQITNVTCPDGLGSEFKIDRLVLRPDGISVLAIKKYPGKIFCADHIDEWTQMLGQKSYHFKNPLFELNYQVKAIADYTPNIDVDGYLFFDHLAHFPKGHPERVIHPASIPDTLQGDRRQPVEPDVMEAWKKIKVLVKH